MAGGVAANYTYDRDAILREVRGATSLKYVHGTRYYDATIGRLVSEDPIAFVGGPNFYEYANSNPANNTDPSGLLGGPTYYDEGTWACAFYWGVQVRFDLWYRGTSNRYAHCLASCLIARYCGADKAFRAGAAKEKSDKFQCLYFGSADHCSSAEDPQDYKDNDNGITCPPRQSCEQRCKNLEYAPDSPGGPYRSRGRR